MNTCAFNVIVFEDPGPQPGQSLQERIDRMVKESKRQSVKRNARNNLGSYTRRTSYQWEVFCYGEVKNVG